jgi:hypothetical protein
MLVHTLDEFLPPVLARLDMNDLDFMATLDGPCRRGACVHMCLYVDARGWPVWVHARGCMGLLKGQGRCMCVGLLAGT